MCLAPGTSLMRVPCLSTSHPKWWRLHETSRPPGHVLCLMLDGRRLHYSKTMGVLRPFMSFVPPPSGQRDRQREARWLVRGCLFVAGFVDYKRISFLLGCLILPVIR